MLPQVTIRPFLMFEGKAEEAMNFYISLFSGAAVNEILRYPDGSIMKASFTVAGQQLLCTDSPVQHGFAFTPSMSLFVECSSEEEIESMTATLSNGGSQLMPLGNYGFSRKFAWVADRFGVSWQLNLS